MDKRCVKCGELRPAEEFYRAKGTRDGLRRECKPCFKKAAKARYEADPATAIARVKRWQQENADRLNAYRRQRRLEPEVKARERAGHLKRKFGLNIEQYDQMLRAQGGGCAICGSGRPQSGKYSLHVDHDHQTGVIRGLLCFRCNNAVGDLDDDAGLLRRAAEYLEAADPEVAELVALARRRALALVS
jgi:hypothetical protein